MKEQGVRRRWRKVGPSRAFRGAAVLVIALTVALPHASQAEVSPGVIPDAILKTVQLFTPMKSVDSDTGAACSGAFISPTGLILTASHCLREEETNSSDGVAKGHLYNPQGLTVVSVNLPNHLLPVPTYVAKRVADGYPSVDLGLLQVTALLGQQGLLPLPGDLRVPFMTIGNADAVGIGDSIAILGFPALGGNTITVTEGHVTGFVVRQGRKYEMKHDAAAAGGASGGPVITAAGVLVAVHVSHRGESGGFGGTGSFGRAVLTSQIPSAWSRYLGAATALAPSRAAQAARPPVAGAPLFPPSPVRSTVVFQGRVVDTVTRAPVPGASVFVLRPDVAFAKATRNDVVALAQTDAGGTFQTTPPVLRGTYPVIVLARGYRPTEGTVEASTQAGDIVTFSVTLARQ